MTSMTTEAEHCIINGKKVYAPNASKMTHTVTKKICNFSGVNTMTVNVRIMKNHIEDAWGNKFDMKTGFRKANPHHSAVQELVLSTLAPIVAE